MSLDDVQQLSVHEEIPGYPYHDFWLRSASEPLMSDYMAVVGKAAPVRIPDALLQYCADSLSWIPTRNPAVSGVPLTLGLHFYGPTIIDHTGVPVFRQICLAWAGLFSAGPSTLVLSAGTIRLMHEDGSQ